MIFFDRDKPLVSIMMPVRNVEEFVEQAIKSFLSQTYRNKELIVVDDGSTDKTVEIVRKYAVEYENIIFLRNNQNLGIPKTRNIALREARGKYVGHLDGDDYIKKRAISKLVAMLEKKRVALVYSGYITVNRTGKSISKTMAIGFDRSRLKELGWRHFGMYNREIALSLGGFNEKLITCSDGDLFMKIAQKYECTRLKSYLYYYRRHSTNIGHKRPHCLDCPKQEVCNFFSVWNSKK